MLMHPASHLHFSLDDLLKTSGCSSRDNELACILCSSLWFVFLSMTHRECFDSGHIIPVPIQNDLVLKVVKVLPSDFL